MRDKRRMTRDEIAARVGDHALLSTFVAPLPPLLARGDRNLADGLGKALWAFSKVRKGAVIQFSTGTRRWHATAGADSIVDGEHKKPNLEIIASEDVMLDILSGELSPLDAFGQGKLRVRGDLGLAGVAARALQNKE
jgi:hypothetical protein